MRSAPFGALPTAVRDRRDDYGVAHVKSVSRSFERVADFARLPVEQVIGAVDLDELLRLLQLGVELAHGLQRISSSRSPWTMNLGFVDCFTDAKS